MDAIRRSQVRMLRRFLEKIQQELRIVLSEEGGSFKTDRAKKGLEHAESSIRDAIKNMQQAIDASEDPEQQSEPPRA
jgi:exonuclease VII small subunit